LVGIQPQILSSKTDNSGTSIQMIPNLSYDITSKPLSSDFDLTVNGKTVAIDSVYFDPKSTYRLVLEVSGQLKSVDVILLSYHGITMQSESGIKFAAMQNFNVSNNSPVYTQLPGTIQAEKFQVNFGLVAETCTDTGAGQDMGNSTAGDYLDYMVYIPTTGNYSVEYRVAAPVGGTLELRVVDNPLAPVVIHSVVVPNTGGWQAWKSVIAAGNLTQGTHNLRLFVKKAEFNINWFKVSLITSAVSVEGSKGIEVYPNPVNDQLHFNTTGMDGKYQVKITSLQGVVVQQFPVELLAGTSGQTDLSALVDGVYIFSIENKTEKHYCRFIKMKD
jgi:hypothetical protein